MRKRTVRKVLLISLGFVLAVGIRAQSVTGSVKSEITNLLKSHDIFCGEPNVTITVDTVKIMPRKLGYLGSCKSGGGPSVLFERTDTGFRKLLAIDTGMNGGFSQDKRLTNGYYDFYHYERSGNEVGITTYKWNGTRYVVGRPRTMRVK